MKPLASGMVILGFAILVLTPVPLAATPVGSQRLLLGSPAYDAPGGVGWGTVEPSMLFNGGDASRSISRIHWRTWGGKVATGRGKNPAFKPHGGYYRRPVTIELHASDIGRCGSGPLVYRRLKVREQTRPAGPLGRWFLWSGSKTLCR